MSKMRNPFATRLNSHRVLPILNLCISSNLLEHLPDLTQLVWKEKELSRINILKQKARQNPLSQTQKFCPLLQPKQQAWFLQPWHHAKRNSFIFCGNVEDLPNHKCQSLNDKSLPRGIHGFQWKSCSQLQDICWGSGTVKIHRCHAVDLQAPKNAALGFDWEEWERKTQSQSLPTKHKKSKTRIYQVLPSWKKS